MFDSPIGYCRDKQKWVALDQSAIACVKDNGCTDTRLCPISGSFAQSALNDRAFEGRPKPEVRKSYVGMRHCQDDEAVEYERVVLFVESNLDTRAAASVRSALELIGGVSSVALSKDHREALISFDPQKANTHQFVRAVKAVGYEASYSPPGLKALTR